MNKTKKTRYQKVEEYFNLASISQLRGNISNAGMMAYAANSLARISPKQGAKLLDVYYRFDIKTTISSSINND